MGNQAEGNASSLTYSRRPKPLMGRLLSPAPTLGPIWPWERARGTGRRAPQAGSSLGYLQERQSRQQLAMWKKEALFLLQKTPSSSGAAEVMCAPPSKRGSEVWWAKGPGRLKSSLGPSVASILPSWSPQRCLLKFAFLWHYLAYAGLIQKMGFRKYISMSTTK